MGLFSQDVRFSLRALRKQPVLGALAVVTLAMGIGANTAIFSVVDVVLLRPRAYPAESPENVMIVSQRDGSHSEMSVSYPDFKDWQQMTRSFESIAAYRDRRFTLSSLDDPTQVEVRLTTYNYFHITGVIPHRGRLYTAEEDRAGAEGVVVLNSLMWQNRFGSDPGILGRSLELNEKAYAVIGVLPADFELLNRERAYLPLEPWADNPSTQDRGNHQGLFVLARAHTGVTFEQARAELESVARQLEQQYPATNSGVGVNVIRLSEALVEDYRATLLVLLAAVCLVLLVACANVANLLLARAVGRGRELAIQAALGASRLRLIQQGLVEGVVLALIGGAVGVLLALWSLGALQSLAPADVPGIDRLALDWRVLGYAVALSLLTGALFGAIPAALAARAQPGDPLRSGGRDTGDRGRARRALMVAEVALASLLLIAAGLLIRSVHHLIRVDPGFRPGHLLTLQIQLPESRYPEDRRALFYRQMQERLEAIPGVDSASASLSIPVLGNEWGSIFIVEDHPVPSRENLPSSIFNPAQVGYFETLGIPLLQGRTFDNSDTVDSPAVIVVNEALARHFWPHESAIGKRLKQGWPEDEGEGFPWREIVGVVGNTKQFGLDSEYWMETYLPLSQLPLSRSKVILRTRLDPLSLMEPAKAAIRSLDPGIPVYDARTMENIVADSVAPRRFAMRLLGGFAGLAVALASIGLYAVVALSVAGRRREIGLRMAVGGERSDIFGLVLREGVSMSVLGAVLGLGAALGLTRWMSGLLYGVTAGDPLTFSLAPLLMVLAAVAGSAVPALTATRIDPISALRSE